MTTKPTKTNKVPIKRPYAVWTVEGEDYKLVLKTAGVCEAEQKLKGQNLINFIGNETGLPTIGSMLIIVHCAMLAYHHGIKQNDVYDLYDKYIESGGSMMEFYTDVFMDIYKVSGFLSKTQSKALAELTSEM